MSFRVFFTLSMNNSSNNNSDRKNIYIYILPIAASVFFLTTVEGPSHSICQLGFQVFILLARRQIKGIMDRTEPGFC